MIVAAVALLMVMAMAADATSGGTGAGIAVDPASGAVSFGGTFQEPVMDTVPDFQRWGPYPPPPTTEAAPGQLTHAFQ